MILHPDGRAEGTPEELTRYQQLRASPPETTPIVIKETRTIKPDIPIEDPIPQPWRIIPGPTVAPIPWKPSTTDDPYLWWKTQTWISNTRADGTTYTINHRPDDGAAGVTANLH